MKINTLFLALLTLLAGVATPALAERGDGDHGRRQMQAEHRGNHQAGTPQRAEQRSQRRFERQRSLHIEQRNAQRVERHERRAQKPARVQRRIYEQPHRAVPRRHVETRRSLHIERPHRMSIQRSYHRVPRSRYYRGIRIYRPYGHLYPGFGYYYSDHDAFRWLAFTALTLTIIDRLDEQQQRMHEQALVRATSATVGDTLYWDDGDAFGSVTVLHIGTDYRGREYREFRQTVSVRGRTETSYARAYLKDNGVWTVSRLN